MKTFKEMLKEDHSNYMGGQVGVPTANSAEDSNIGAHNIENADVLKRVNAFVSSICQQEYMNPQAAVEQLASKLRTLGLDMTIPEMSGNGSVNLEVTQFGGRFGKDIDGSDIKDDGISHKKEGGLKMEISYETLKNGASRVYAKLV